MAINILVMLDRHPTKYIQGLIRCRRATSSKPEYETRCLQEGIHHRASSFNWRQSNCKLEPVGSDNCLIMAAMLSLGKLLRDHPIIGLFGNTLASTSSILFWPRAVVGITRKKMQQTLGYLILHYLHDMSASHESKQVEQVLCFLG